MQRTVSPKPAPCWRLFAASPRTPRCCPSPSWCRWTPHVVAISSQVWNARVHVLSLLGFWPVFYVNLFYWKDIAITPRQRWLFVDVTAQLRWNLRFELTIAEATDGNHGGAGSGGSGPHAGECCGCPPSGGGGGPGAPPPTPPPPPPPPPTPPPLSLSLRGTACIRVFLRCAFLSPPCSSVSSAAVGCAAGPPASPAGHAVRGATCSGGRAVALCRGQGWVIPSCSGEAQLGPVAA
jgi:hypothetical protein